MRRGCRMRGGSFFLWKGEAKQKTSVLKISFAPRPVPNGSRLTPTIPVSAPPYGSKAEGELCVSTLKTKLASSLNLITPALSTNTERQKSFFPLDLRILAVEPLI